MFNIVPVIFIVL